METQAYLEMKQTKQLEEAANCMRDQVLIRLNRRLGCRVTELLNIGKEDFQFEAGTVSILHEKTHVKMLCPGCKQQLAKKFKICPYCGVKVDSTIERASQNKKLRTLPIDEDTLALVKEYIDSEVLHWNGKKHLIFNIGRNRAWQIITEAAARAGLPKIVNTESGVIHNVSSHRLRDAFAVNAVLKDDSGDGLRILQEHLGHADIGTTMNYRKVAGQEHAKWYGNIIGKDE